MEEQGSELDDQKMQKIIKNRAAKEEEDGCHKKAKTGQ